MKPIYILLVATWILSFQSILTGAPLEIQPTDYDSFAINSRLLCAEAALRTGLPSIAEHLFTQTLDEIGLPADLKERATIGLIDAYLSAHKLTDARLLLANWEATDTPRYALRAAWIAYGQADWDNFSRFIQQCPIEALPETERPWIHLAKGLEAMHKGYPLAAEPFLEKAKNTCQTPAQQAWIEALIDENKLLSGPVTEALLQDLKSKTQTYRNQPAGPRFAEEYALALAASGSIDAALSVLEDELKRLPTTADTQESHLLFLMGTLGKGSEKGTNAFKRLLETKSNPDLGRAALYALAQIEPPEVFEKTLTHLIEGTDNQLLLGDLLLLRAAFYLSKKQWESAEVDAKKALTLLPRFKITALDLLATVAWERTQYRTAADYLSQWRQEVNEATDRARLTGWMGDAYFLAKDFPQASLLYREALAASLPFEKGRLAYQAVLSNIQEEKLTEAIALLDTQPLSLSERWKAEWNLAEAFRKKNQASLAHARLKGLHSKAGLDQALMYRFMWLEAILALESQSPGEAAQKAGHLVRLLNEKNLETLYSEDLGLLLTEAILLEGEALMAIHDNESAIARFQTLRQHFPSASATPRSYLIEGRMQAAAGHTVEAQQRLIELADAYPLSPYAPIALFEAAILASNRGISQATQEALNLLERLIENYPQNDLVLAARMEQGKLLCRLGDFSAAELLYSTLIPGLKDKPERYPLMLARANCLLAQAETSPNKLNEATALLERLFDQPSLPSFLKSEAGYKWGFALEAQKNTRQAEEIYWQLLHNVATGATTPAEGEGYWLARAAFSLANLLESRNEPTQARKLYQIIIDSQLPGGTLARTKLEPASTISLL